MNTDDWFWFGGNQPRVPQLLLPTGIGLDLNSWGYTPQLSDRSVLKILWVGSMVKRKRPFDAMHVVRHLQNRGINVELRMLGEGPLLAQVQKVSEAMEGVHVLGKSNPMAHLQSSHALIHTAEWEGLPRVLLEAAAVGRPSFGYAVKGVRDAPGVLTTPRKLGTGGFAALVANWWGGHIHPPDVDRSSLDWTSAHDSVTHLLKRVVSEDRSY